jgi:hypothetical protein
MALIAAAKEVKALKEVQHAVYAVDMVVVPVAAAAAAPEDATLQLLLLLLW